MPKPASTSAEGHCGNPPNITGAILTFNVRDPYGVATYQCEDGKWFSDLERKKNLTCMVHAVASTRSTRSATSTTNIFKWEETNDTCKGRNGIKLIVLPV